MKKITYNKKRIFALIMSACLLLSALPFTAMAADSVAYLDAGGETQYCTDYEIIDSSSTALSAGWYVLNSSVEISSLVTVTGDVYIILENGCTLTCSAGVNVASGNSLTVFAQSTDQYIMGAVNATGTSTQAGIGSGSRESSGSITINGGNITATGGGTSATSGSAGIGTGSGGTIYQLSTGAITINGGYVSATGGNVGAGIGGGYYGSGTGITINGGTVEATGGTYGAGIGGGSHGSGTYITITGGSVTATGGSASLITQAGIGSGYSSSGESDIYVAPDGVVCSIAVLVGTSGATDLLSGAPFANGTTSEDLADTLDDYQYFYSYEINSHSYIYTADSNVITAVCEYCGDEQSASITAESTTYNGKEQQTATVTYSDNWPGGELEVQYKNNTAAGTATAEITCNDLTASTEFTISQKSVADSTVSIANIATQCYTGAELTPQITVSDSETGENLAEGTDYSVQYSDNTEIGTATVTISGTGNYTGSASTSFTISSHSYAYTASGNTIYETCTNCGISATATITAQNATYDGTEHKTAAVTYSEGWAGGSLDIVYTDNVEVGTATATISIGNASASAQFEIEVDGIYYLDSAGERQVCSEYNVIDSDSTTLTSGWYAVTSSVDISSLVTVTGDVHLILSDGCTLTCSSGINVSDSYSFTIYAQSTGESTMGVLITTGSGRQAGIGGGQNNANGTIVINGGEMPQQAASP
ncbi:MAG: hypothetical protein LUH82_07285 [Clostridiales bacterium]|nr:hypothetical protein [Clostridiales bacterium]